MACYYIVISSTHLSNGHFRNIKGVFRGPLSKNGNKTLDYAEKEKTMAKALEDLKANFYCELCDKQYYKHQEFDNHINSYDHAHKQRLKELKHREFARNVASKSRKDEKKQEKALKRLHELAEQRKEVQCAPGSGPMFKSTTVAVEDSFKEMYNGTHSFGDGKTEHIKVIPPCGAGEVKDAPPVQLACQSEQFEGPHDSTTKKQGYGQKIGFSFSFPKKVSVKLESSAAVFCENAEEGSMKLSFRQKNRVVLSDCNIAGTPTAVKGQNNREEIHIADNQQENFSDKSATSQVQRPYDVSVTPNNTDPNSSLCTFLIYPEDTEISSSSELPTFPENISNKEIELTETLPDSIESSVREFQSETSEQLAERSKMGINISEENGTGVLSVSPLNGTEIPSLELHSSESTEKVTNRTDKNPCIFVKPNKPFSSVLSKDGTTILQWPSEMLTFTKTEPPLSYSCNPLHFDFKSSRYKAESESNKGKATESHAVKPAVKDPLTDDNSCVNTALRGTEKLSHCDKHSTKPSDGCGYNPMQKDIDFAKQNINFQEPGESLQINNNQSHERHSSIDTRQKKHKHSSKCSKNWKKSSDKSWKQDRQDYQTCKRRRRRKAMYHLNETQKARNKNDIDTEKYKHFPKQGKCIDGFNDQFGSDSSAEVEPLEESKQSHQNQEQNGSGSNKAMDTARMKTKAAGSINSTAGTETFFNESCTDHEVVLRSSEKNLYNPSTEQMNTTGRCTYCCDMACKEKPCIIHGRSDEVPLRCGEENNKQHTQFLKRRHGCQNELEEPCLKRRLCMTCTSLGKSSCALNRPGVYKQSRRRKRRRKIHAGNQSVCMESLSRNSATETIESENGLTTVFPEVNGSSESSFNLLTDNFENNVIQEVVMYTECVSNSTPSQVVSSSNSDSTSPESLLVKQADQTESSSFVTESKNTSPNYNHNVRPEIRNEKSSEKTRFEKQSCKEVMQFRGQDLETVARSHSCQFRPNSHHQKCHQTFQCQDAKINYESVRSAQMTGSFPGSCQSLLLSSEDMEKHKTLHVQAHRQVFHAQRFPAMLKPILAAPPLPVSPPVLHPVHLPQPMSSASITIQHTIFQHHTAAMAAATCSFLQPQPQIVQQVFPLPRPPLPHLSLGAEMCPGSHHPFIPASQLPVVAPAALHPTSLTIHALPRSAVFSPMLPSHPAVIPLQSLF
ncbi:zinc finger protein 804A [Lepisosteus oculatus]|uniref:zinc finger protein 804A n=1 Tax=Lepisosteus oculatus TaxID=7918 RepID=UPI0035F51921